MTSELVPTRRHFRKEIPESHRASMDTRLRWLWNQRFGTVQNIWKDTTNLEDRTACTIVLQSIVGDGDLNSIKILFARLEGGALMDDENVERRALRI